MEQQFVHKWLSIKYVGYFILTGVGENAKILWRFEIYFYFMKIHLKKFKTIELKIYTDVQ